MTNFWWVNQGKTYAWESELNLLWAPLKNGKGRKESHWERMDDVAPGDVVFHYSKLHLRAISEVLTPARKATKPYKNPSSDDWEESGREVSLRMYPLASPLPLNEIPLELRQEWQRTGAQFDKNGDVKQGYLFEQPREAAQWVMEHLGLVTKSDEPPIESTPAQNSNSNEELFIVVGPDGQVTASRRPEQARLKRFLFGQRTVNLCALCGKELPNSLLVVSHIKKRSHSDLHERGDLNIVMAACALGCDAIYERGYITVNTHGLIQQGPRNPETNHLRSYINDMLGRRVTAHSPGTSKYFEWHHNWHNKQSA